MWKMCQCLGWPRAVMLSSSSSHRYSTSNPSSSASTSPASWKVIEGSPYHSSRSPKKVAREAAAGAERSGDPGPQRGELGGRTERQREARIHQIDLRPVERLEPAGPGLQPARRGQIVARGEPFDGRRLRVDGEHRPAAAQDLDGVAARAAAQIDGAAPAAGLPVEGIERPDQGRARRAAAGLLVIGGPGRAGAGRSCPGLVHGGAQARSSAGGKLPARLTIAGTGRPSCPSIQSAVSISASMSMPVRTPSRSSM